MHYALIKDWVIAYMTDYKPEEEDIAFDEIIEIKNYSEGKRYEFIDGKIIEQIIVTIDSTEEEKQRLRTEIWKLSIQRTGMLELEESTEEIDSKIEALKTEYKALTA